MAQYLKKKIKDERGVYVPVYGKTPEELERKVQARKAEVERKKALQATPLVWEYARDWFARRTRDLSYSRKQDYSNAMNRHILPRIGNMRLPQVTREDIAAIMDAAPKSDSSRIKIAGTLRQLFQAAVKDGIIAATPCDELKAGGEKAKEKTALTDTQAATLLRVMQGMSIHPFIMLGLYAGLRREEILGLQWRFVHLATPTPFLQVRRAVTFEGNKAVVSDKLKSRAAQRDIPLPPVLADYLQKIQPKQEEIGDLYVVSGPEPWSNTQFRNAWRCITRRQAGECNRMENGKRVQKVKKMGETVRNSKVKIEIDFAVTPHILRHTYITNLILSGANVKRVQYLAGHSKIKTTLDIYTHLMDSSPEANMEAVLNAFGPKKAEPSDS